MVLISNVHITEANWGPKRRHGRGGETKEEVVDAEVKAEEPEVDAIADQKHTVDAEPAAKRAKN